MYSTNSLEVPWYKNWSEPKLEANDNYLGSSIK